MDFDYTPQEQSFREEVRGFIAEHLPPKEQRDKNFLATWLNVSASFRRKCAILTPPVCSPSRSSNRNWLRQSQRTPMPAPGCWTRLGQPSRTGLSSISR